MYSVTLNCVCVSLQDLLNNLDSCELDDDDLMLDDELPEDTSLHSGMCVVVFVCIRINIEVIKKILFS